MPSGLFLWAGNFTTSGSADMLALSTQEGNWWLGSMSGSPTPALSFECIGNSRFGDIRTDPFWRGRFKGGAQDDLLFYSKGDGNWWLGSLSGTPPNISINWHLAATHSVDWLVEAPTWVADESPRDR